MEKRLRNGEDIHFDNEEWCEDNLSDDLMCGWVTYHAGYGLFAILFNGACIHTSKTFSSAKKRLEKLMSDWHCKFIKD